MREKIVILTNMLRYKGPLITSGRCFEMVDAAVLLATAASIFGGPALLFLFAVRDLRRIARIGFGSTSPSSQSESRKVVVP